MSSSWPLIWLSPPLLGALFSVHMEKGKVLESIDSEAPSPLDLPSGCPFQDRCENCMDKCKTDKPVMAELGPGHLAACHLYKARQ